MERDDKWRKKRRTLSRDQRQERTRSNIQERVGKPRGQVEGMGTVD